MFYYKALTGSRLLGTHTDSSDTDFIIVSDEPIQHWASIRERGEDFFPRSPARFLADVFEAGRGLNAWRSVGALFAKPVENTLFSEYLLSNRENLFASNLQYFGDIILRYCEKMAMQGNNKQPYGVIFPKRTIYAIIFLNAYIRYATENILFEQAFQPQAELRDFILKMRHGEVPYEAQMEKLCEMLVQAEAVKEFYNKEPDLKTFYRIESEMKAILNIA